MSAAATETPYRDLLPVIVEREGAVLPDGCDTWGVKSVHPDLRTYNGYRWPFPGGIAEATDVNEAHTDACPSRPGDGLCVATTWAAMASGGIPARTLLLVATSSGDVLGSDARTGKSRHRLVAVVALVDGERLIRAEGIGANLRGANLNRANLNGARLDGANLYGANLYGARLIGARLDGANLYGTRLIGARLNGANLVGARLYGANLYGARLDGARLNGANLVGARLDGHDLGDLRARGAIL